jgi:hypothetical protein
MRLPLRGDPQSRLVIGLALFCRFSGWLCLTWLPLAIAIALPRLLKSQENEDIPTMVGFAVGLFVGVLFDAVIWLLLARGMMSGNRAAYIVAALGLLAASGLSALTVLSSLLLSPSVPTIVMFTSYFIMFAIAAVVVGVVSLKEAFTRG